MRTSKASFQRWGERILASIGLMLIVVFVVVRVGQAEERDAGLAAFEAQVAGVASPQAYARSAEFSSAPEVRALPDQSTWSAARIEAYAHSLQQDAAPPLAVLRIDRLGIEVPVFNGTDDRILDRGAGRILGTARIDEPGNLGIAAHRDGFFRPLKDVELGDVLELRTLHGKRRYVVESTTIVDPHDVSVLLPSDEHVITLVTCYPFYFVGSAPQRFIVRASVVEASPTHNEGHST